MFYHTCFTIHVLLYMFYHTRFSQILAWRNKYWSKKLYTFYHTHCFCTLFTFVIDLLEKCHSIDSNFSKNRFLMKCHISCSSMQLHMNHAHYTVIWWIAMAQNEQEVPWASQLLFPHHTLLLVIYIVNIILWLTCRDFQVEFSWFSLRNCVWNVKESGLTCGSRARLTYSIQCGNLDWHVAPMHG